MSDEKKRLPIAAVGALLWLLSISPNVTVADLVLDQQSPAGYGAFLLSSLVGYTDTYNGLQQGVTAGRTGQLSQIDLYVSQAGNAEIYINKGTPWQSDASEFSIVVTPKTTGWISIDTSKVPDLFFNAGEQFVIGIMPEPSTTLQLGGNSGGYAAGELWQDWHALSNDYPMAYGDGSLDLAFKTYVEPAHAPLPGALLLGSIGLSFAGWQLRRREAP